MFNSYVTLTKLDFKAKLFHTAAASRCYKVRQMLLHFVAAQYVTKWGKIAENEAVVKRAVKIVTK